MWKCVRVCVRGYNCIFINMAFLAGGGSGQWRGNRGNGVGWVAFCFNEIPMI